jgi:S-adenosylmethionine:diacylglycerol 3-amino-3-carboxypropyl transferase
LVKQNHVTVDSVNIEAFELYGKYPSTYPVPARIQGFNPRQIIAKVVLGVDRKYLSLDLNQSHLDPVLAKIGDA